MHVPDSLSQLVCDRDTILNADGSDFTQVHPKLVSNLRFSSNQNLPDRNFTVEILNDDVAEPVEYLEVRLACDGNENCYFPRSSYTITIVDDQGMPFKFILYEMELIYTCSYNMGRFLWGSIFE